MDGLATLVVTSSFLEKVRGWLGHPGGHLEFSGGGLRMAWPLYSVYPIHLDFGGIPFSSLSVPYLLPSRSSVPLEEVSK